MSNLSAGYAFGATEQVTAAKLGLLVTGGTAYNIVATDITDGVINDVKMVSLGGNKLINLNLTPVGAGVIPKENLTSVAQKGANSDITSLAGLTTPLSRAQGGLGSTIADNVANGVVVNDANGYLVGDGRNLTNLPTSNTSNVVFSWNSNEFYAADIVHNGFVTDVTTLTDTSTNGGYSYTRVAGLNPRTILTSKLRKIAGISTVTIYAKIWSNTNGAEYEAFLKVDIGGQNNTVKSITSTTPTWVTSSDIDISSLTNGTVYDITIQLYSENSDSYAYCDGIILIGS